MARDSEEALNDAAAGGPATITVVGAGPGPHDLVSLRGARRIERAQLIYHEQGISAALLGRSATATQRIVVEDRAAQAAQAAATASNGTRVVWVVHGSGSDTDLAPLRAACTKHGVGLQTVPGVVGAPDEATLPLAGVRVIVTRAQHQAGDTCGQLEDLGAEAISMPTIAIAEPTDCAQLDRAVAQIGGYRHLLLTSANAVPVLARTLERVGLDTRALAGVEIDVIGPATAQALANIGLRADRTATDYRAEGLLEQLTADRIAGQRILLLRAAVAREILPETLRERGAEVDVVAAYVTTTAPEQQWQAGIAALRAGSVDVLTLTSASTAKNFARIAGDELEELTRNVTIAVIGPITAEACIRCGLEVDVEAASYTVPALIDHLVDYLHARRQESVVKAPPHR